MDRARKTEEDAKDTFAETVGTDTGPRRESDRAGKDDTAPAEGGTPQRYDDWASI